MQTVSVSTVKAPCAHPAGQWQCQECFIAEVSIGRVAFCSPAILDLKTRPLWMRSYPALHPLPTKAGSPVAIGLQFPFSSLQKLLHGASVPGHPGLPCWHTPGFRSCEPCLGHPVTLVPVWNPESASSHTELNSRAVRLPAALWVQPLSNKVKLV